MARIWRLQFGLTGWQGAPGVNTFHTTVPPSPGIDSPSDVVSLFRSAYSEVVEWFASGITIASPAEILELDVETGELQEVHAVGPQAPVFTGSGVDAMSRATMGKLRFRTDSIVDGRRIHGGCFLGPVGTNAVENDGSISGAFNEAAANAFEGLMNAIAFTEARLAVYQRPRKASAGLPSRVGSFGHVQSVDLMPMPAVLRSRRD